MHNVCEICTYNEGECAHMPAYTCICEYVQAIARL